MENSPIEQALKQVNNISLTIAAEEMEEVSRVVMQAPAMNSSEADSFMKDIHDKGIDALKTEMGEKQFLIKCFRAAAYYNKPQNGPF